MNILYTSVVIAHATHAFVWPVQNFHDMVIIAIVELSLEYDEYCLEQHRVSWSTLVNDILCLSVVNCKGHVFALGTHSIP